MRPYNRRLMVEVVEKGGSNEQGILLVPDDYKEEERYTLCKVLSTSEDVSLPWSLALIETHLIEEVEVEGETYRFAPVSAVVMVGDND